MEIYFICGVFQCNRRFTQPLHWITSQEVILADKLIAILHWLFKNLIFYEGSIHSPWLLSVHFWSVSFRKDIQRTTAIIWYLNIVIQIILILTAANSPANRFWTLCFKYVKQKIVSTGWKKKCFQHSDNFLFHTVIILVKAEQKFCHSILPPILWLKVKHSRWIYCYFKKESGLIPCWLFCLLCLCHIHANFFFPFN